MDQKWLRIDGKCRPKGLTNILRYMYGFVKYTKDRNHINKICESYKRVNQTKSNTLINEMDFRTSIVLIVKEYCLHRFTNFKAIVDVTTLLLISLSYNDLQQVPWNELDLPDFTMIERVYLLVCNFGRLLSHENKYKTCSRYHASSFNHYKR